jgi:adenine-specific DNA-methyltransferase
VPPSFEDASTIVRRLVADFDAHKHVYLGAAYTEAEVREDFVNKFFTALGWDVSHDIQKNPFEQEVKIERGVTDGPAKRRADY